VSATPMGQRKDPSAGSRRRAWCRAWAKAGSLPHVCQECCCRHWGPPDCHRGAGPVGCPAGVGARLRHPRAPIRETLTAGRLATQPLVSRKTFWRVRRQGSRLIAQSAQMGWPTICAPRAPATLAALAAEVDEVSGRHQPILRAVRSSLSGRDLQSAQLCPPQGLTRPNLKDHETSRPASFFFRASLVRGGPVRVRKARRPPISM